MLARTWVAALLAGLCTASSPAPAESLLLDRPLTAAEERQLRPGDRFRECRSCPLMVVVPAGTFLMGSPENEPGRDNDEGPQQQVTIAVPFAAGSFEVTFAEWDACLEAGGCNGYRPSDQGWGRGRNPLIIVSWEDAQAYVAWLSAATGRPYRLPTEAEWEYAARAGSTAPFWWGRSISTEQANFDGTAPHAGARPGELRRRTMPVDSFAANRFGLYNVHGNVWEWVEDCWHRRYRDMPEAMRQGGGPWISPGCSERVFRGGSWADGATVLRAANRGRYEPFIRNTGSGFRVARTLAR